MQVHNLNDTSQNKCQCVSWLVHWGRFSGQPANTCAVLGCMNLPSVGGHVQQSGGSDDDRSWYIIPLCSSCNAQRGASLYIRDDVQPVSANVSDTCGKAYVSPLGG